MRGAPPVLLPANFLFLARPLQDRDRGQEGGVRATEQTIRRLKAQERVKGNGFDEKLE